MRVTFILPGPGRKAMGGYKVVYEYADRLVGRGHEVVVAHSLRVPYLPYRVPYPARKVLYRITRSQTPKWFEFRHPVELKLIDEISDKCISDSDVVVATWWGTAYPVSKLDATKGSKFYLIQEYVFRGGDEELVHESFRLGLSNLVIAGWIKDAVRRNAGAVAAHIPNGVDTEHFKLLIPVEDRNPASVAMLYHEADFKGSKDGIAALEIVKQTVPALQATLFSVYRRPKWLPDWIRFVHNPSQTALVDTYNEHAIFVAPSWSEGWPLPPAESMACGCALVTTNIAGINDYAVRDQTALLSPPKDPPALAENIVRLIGDNHFRILLAKRGKDLIGSFTWEKAVDSLESAFLDSVRK